MSVCVSHPKSGRTWLRVMFRALEVPISFTHIDTGADKASWGKHVRKLERPQPMPQKTVFLHRDPRDTVVSFFHEMTKRNPLSPGRRLRFALQGRLPPLTMEAFVRSPRFGIEKIAAFNISCARHLDAHAVSYEEMRENPVQRLSEILEYLGHSVEREKIERVVADHEFTKMREREAAGHYESNKLRPTDPRDQSTYKVRRGKVGGWRDEMDEDTRVFSAGILENYRYFERMAELV